MPDYCVPVIYPEYDEDGEFVADVVDEEATDEVCGPDDLDPYYEEDEQEDE